MPSQYVFDTSKLLSWDAIQQKLKSINEKVSSDVLATNPPSLAIIASCGSYNPITTAHVRMLESAKHFLDGHLSEDEKGLYSAAPQPPQTVVTLGGFVSPVSDKYQKGDLAPFTDRKAVCDIVLKKSSWAAVDAWEGLQAQYERTFTVLSHIRREVRAHYAATATTEEEKLLANSIDLYFLCGGDLFETFYRSGVWDLSLLEKIFREFRLLVVARVGSQDPLDTIAACVQPLTHPSTPETSLDLRLYRDRVRVLRIPENTTSSTQIREGLRNGAAAETLAAMVTEEALAYLKEKKVYA